MANSKLRIPEEMQRWIDARRRFHLSHAQVQMARELGMNPRKLGGLANHRQEPWKAPLPVFIEQLYQKRFGKVQPDRVLSIEDRVQEIAAKKAERRERRQPRVDGSDVLPRQQPDVRDLLHDRRRRKPRARSCHPARARPSRALPRPAPQSSVRSSPSP